MCVTIVKDTLFRALRQRRPAARVMMTGHLLGEELESPRAQGMIDRLPNRLK